MNPRYVAVFLGALTVAVGLYFLTRSNDDVVVDDRLESVESKDPRRLPGAQSMRAPSADAAPSVASQPAKIGTKAAVGRIEVDLEPAEAAYGVRLDLVADKPGLNPVRTDRGFTVDDVAPDVYRLTLSGGGIIPRVVSGIRVVAGEVAKVKMSIEQGITVGGQIFDALKKVPIPGAEVWIAGLRVTTDSDGRFTFGQTLSRTDITEITVKCDDYDTIVYRNHPINDPSFIQLALGGGGCDVLCKFDNQLGAPLPVRMNTRITINPGIWTMRRERAFSNQSELLFKNLYGSDYRVEVRFPDGEHPAILFPFTTNVDEKHKELTLPLLRGAKISGKVIGPENVVNGLVLELVTQLRGESIYEVTVGKDAVYEMKNIQPGDYFLRMKQGVMTQQLPPLIVTSIDPVQRDIDVLRHAYVDAK